MKKRKENRFDRLVDTHSWYGSGTNAGIEILRANTAKDLLRREHLAVLRVVWKMAREYRHDTSPVISAAILEALKRRVR